MARIPDLGGAFSDLVTFFRARGRSDYILGALALAITGFILFAVNHDSYFERAPDITYVEIFAANRTDAEIEAGNKKRSADRHAAQAERQREFRQLADQLGIEVDNKQ